MEEKDYKEIRKNLQKEHLNKKIKEREEDERIEKEKLDAIKRKIADSQSLSSKILNEKHRQRKLKDLKKEFPQLYPESRKNREYISKSTRIEVRKRDNDRCVDCGSEEDLEFDHIIPYSKGGSSSANNIQILCRPCNRRKSNKLA